MKHLVGTALFVQLLLGQGEYARQDALLFQATYFQPLDTLTIATYWDDTAGRSESMYNGNGSWGLGYADWPTRPYDADSPLVRVVARHALGLLLLIEEELADSTTIHRSRTALHWLRERQMPSGAWPLYTVNRGVVSVYSVYPTALAGRALSLGFRLLKNPRYHIAASKALDWQEIRPVTDSPFHQGLELAQRVEHYRAVRHQDDLDGAVELALTIISAQLPNGSWNDPGPIHTDEHAIITEALLMLETELAQGHPRRRRIKAGTTGALNYLLESQGKDGNFATGPDEARATKVPTFEISALISARKARSMVEFDQPIIGAIRAVNRPQANRGNLWRGSQDGRFLGMANALIWFVTTQANLPIPSPPVYLPISPADKKASTDSMMVDSLATLPTVKDSIDLSAAVDSSGDKLAPMMPSDSLSTTPTDTLRSDPLTDTGEASAEDSLTVAQPDSAQSADSLQTPKSEE